MRAHIIQRQVPLDIYIIVSRKKGYRNTGILAEIGKDHNFDRI